MHTRVVEFVQKIFNIIRYDNDLFISFFWGTTAGIVSQGMNFVTNILIARVLKESLGDLIIIVSANSALLTFTVFGLGTMATVLIAKRTKSIKKLMSIIPAMYGVVLLNSGLISLIAVFINTFKPFDLTIWPNQSATSICLSIAWLIFSSIDALQVGLIIGLSKFKILTYVSLIRGIVSILLIYPMVKMWGIAGGISGYAISYGICSFISFILINREVSGLFKRFSFPSLFRIPAIRYILHYSFPIFLASFFISPAQWLANGIIFSKDTSGLALSTFAVVNQWLVLIQFLPAQIAKVVLPHLAKQSGTKNFVKTDKLGLIISLTIAIGISLFSMIFARFIIGLYGFPYDTTIGPFRIILLTGFFSTFNLLYGQSLVAKGETWKRAIADLIAALVIIGFASFSGMSILIYALPLGYLFSYFLSSGVLVISSIKISSLKS